MRAGVQLVSILAFSIGMGLLIGGRSINPEPRGDHVVQAIQAVQRHDRNYEFYRDLSSGLKGAGAALLTLGSLGLIVPWVNILIDRRDAVSSHPRHSRLPPGEPALPH